MHVARAGRQVDDEIVQVAPPSLGDELLQRVAGHSPAPHDGTAGIDEEADGQQPHPVALHGHDARLPLHFLHHGAGIFHAEHLGDGRAVYVGIEQADAVALLGEGDGQVGRHGGLAHAAFAGEHGYGVLHACQRFFDLRAGGLPVLHGDVSFDVHLLANVGENSLFGCFDNGLRKGVVRLVEHQGERNGVAGDADVVLHHFR